MSGPDLARVADERGRGVLDETATLRALERAGFTDPKRACACLDLLWHHARAELPVPELLAGAGASADPGRSLLNLSRLLAQPDVPPCPVGPGPLAAFLGASQHMADVVIGRPALVAGLGRPFDEEGAPRRYLEAGAGEDAETELREAQHADLLSIAWQDLVEDADVELVTAMLSRLADASVAGAAAGLTVHRHFAVVALGKLGGSELNYSSDIDLVFVRPDTATDQVGADRVARQLVRLLARQTPRGHLYRVDMRLRPEGGAGALTRTVTSCMQYYRTLGRPWERQMLLKARVLCDASGAGRAFVDGTRRWIVDRGLDAGAIRQFKRLKSVSESHHAARPGREDVKHQPGGIRDIEAVVQFLQLVHAGLHPELLVPGTLAGLERLRVAGAIGSLDAARLRTAYRFHRRVENRLQVMHRVQTHLLPEHRAALARLTGLRDVRAFDDEFAEHRARVRDVFERVVARSFPATGAAADELANQLLAREPDPASTRRALVELGFGDEASNVAVLRRAAAPVSRFLPDTPRMKHAFASIAPRVLERLSLAADPDAALDRFERMTRGVGAREILYGRMQEDPRLLAVLCDLAAGSPYLCDLLIQSPPIVDAVMDALVTGTRGRSRRRAALERLHRARAGGRRADAAVNEDPWLVLSDHKTIETLRIGVADLQDAVPTRTTLAELSHLCLDVLRHAFDLVLADQVREHGSPTTIRGMGLTRRADMTVVAMGKLGGLEANYASDADLVFVYDGDGQSDTGLTNAVFFTRVAEAFMAAVSGSRGGARLYKIDTRLRPEGNKGPLVTSLRAFKRYYESPRAALFERQALLKARIAAGDAELGQKVLKIVRDVVRRVELPDDYGRTLKQMRSQIESSAHGRDLKRGTGGMVDIEFLVQALQLRHGRADPSILVPETPRALGALADAGRLPASRAERLLDTYLFFRRVETRLQLHLGIDTKEVPKDARAVRDLAIRLGYADTAEGDAGHLLLVDVEERAAQTRREFDALVSS